MRGINLIRALVALWWLTSALATEAALAQETEPPTTGAASREEFAQDVFEADLPGLISADQIIYDEALGIVTASGNVEISQDERVLVADAISYNLRTDLVTAAGNVSLLDPSGNVVFAEYAELTGDLREGFIKSIQVLLTDRSRLAAASGLRTGGNTTVLRRGVFSPCEPCREDPTRPPLWQIKAAKVVHDQEDRTIRYGSAWLEFAGVPVLYTPYLQHPDPTVERKSGFLAPTIGGSDTLGTVVQIPYFINISPSADVTLEPIFTSKQSVVLAGGYRHLLPFGYHEIDVSVTSADRERNDGTNQENALRGHFDGTGQYEINENWRTGFDIQRASDDTYLRVYNFSDTSYLTSNLYAERFEGRDYFAVNGLAFQGLREEQENDELPIVAPLIDLNLVSEPWIADSTLSLDANTMVISRIEGRDVRRLSLKGGWEVPFIDPIGGVYKMAASVQADGYWSENFDAGNIDPNPDGDTDTELSGRVFPQLALQWRYPWVSYGSLFDQVIQPTAQIVLGPDGSNPDEIPNEDSLDFEFDDTNLFSPNRFPGLDRIESGQRIDYGLQWNATTHQGRQAGFFIGQSFRFSREDELFPENSGVQEKLSDIVGRVRIQPIQYFDLFYRFRLDKNDLSRRRDEIDFRIGPPALNLNLDYLFTDSTGLSSLEDREEINVKLQSRLSENWTVFFSGRRDLERNDNLSASAGFTYQDECFRFSLIGQRRYFRDREVEPDDSIFVQISFKHLGGFSGEQGP